MTAKHRVGLDFIAGRLEAHNLNAYAAEVVAAQWAIIAAREVAAQLKPYIGQGPGSAAVERLIAALAEVE